MMEGDRALLRYNAKIEFKPIPVLASRANGVRPSPAPHALRGEAQTFVRDRANAAHAVADALRGGNSLRETA